MPFSQIIPPSPSPKRVQKTVLYICVSFSVYVHNCWGFPGGSVLKNLLANAKDMILTPGWGRSPEEGNGNPLQYSCLKNPTGRKARQATVLGAKSQTQLSD